MNDLGKGTGYEFSQNRDGGPKMDRILEAVLKKKIDARLIIRKSAQIDLEMKKFFQLLRDLGRFINIWEYDAKTPTVDLREPRPEPMYVSEAVELSIRLRDFTKQLDDMFHETADGA